MNCILHLSRTDFGGSGLAAVEIHKNMINLGIDSYMIVLRKRTNIKNIFEISNSQSIEKLNFFVSKILFYIISKSKYQYHHSNLLSRGNIRESISNLTSLKFDAIISHDCSGFLSFNQIALLANILKSPVIFYPLDMEPFTGGCHYAWDCKLYHQNCYRCPAIIGRDKLKISNKLLLNKQKVLSKLNHGVLAASETLHVQIKNSMLFKDTYIKKLLLSVDLNTFRSYSKSYSRNKLGLPINKKIILYGNQSLKLKRKGSKEFFKSIEKLVVLRPKTIEDSLLVILGKEPVSLKLAIPYLNLGYLNSLEDLVYAYNSSNFFVCSSIQDSGPIMINQSIASGVPVISFDMGVASDLIFTEKTGYKAKPLDIDDLTLGMNQFLSNNEEINRQISLNCLELSKIKLDPKKHIFSIMEFIKDLNKYYGYTI
tara:strand:+ start:5253 stop:6530 length:1278 start_codon:yes stop_codon:yes gene_type:complete